MNNKLHIFLIFSFGCYALNGELIVQVKQGLLEGTNRVTTNGRNYSAFLGIPYAKPPVGNLRFRSPIPADKWDGIREAKSYASPCLNTIFGVMTYGKEDCLYLDVYTPLLDFKTNKSTNKTLLPVMVYIFGGTYFFGSTDSYSGDYLLDKDIVLMLMNHRLGVFGFLSTGDSEAPGNFGMKDQVLALKWVQENIKAFGGDPNRVTIFGISSGSVSVHLHALSKASNGLFHQYIMQSGTALTPWAYRDSNDIFQSVKKIAEFLFCPTVSTKSLIRCLRKKRADSLLVSSAVLGFIIQSGKITWAPTNETDSEDAFLTDHPLNLMGQMKDFPCISGVVANEGAFLLTGLYSMDVLYNFMQKALKFMFIDTAIYSSNNQKELAVKLAEFYLNNLSQPVKKLEELNAYATLLSDGYFVYPEVRMLDKIIPTKKTSSYVYSYGYRSSYSVFYYTVGDNTNYGVPHVEDILNYFPLKYLTIDSTKGKLSATDLKIKQIMIDLWTSFATNGVPVSKELDKPDLWRPYDTQSNTHLQIGNIYNNRDPSVTLSYNYYRERMDFWRKNVPT